jgi:hypothetical protein
VVNVDGLFTKKLRDSALKSDLPVGLIGGNSYFSRQFSQVGRQGMPLPFANEQLDIDSGHFG